MTGWRAMTDADLDGVVAVARVAFPDHPEDRACFAERLSLYPRGCRVLENGGGRVAGYGIAYPWTADSAPPLNALVGAIPADASLIYLHDLAILPETRGQGAAPAFIDWLARDAGAQGWTTIALTAVNDAARFWARHGFVERHTAVLAAKLASYGGDARYMVRAL